MSIICSNAHEDECTPCSSPEIHGRPDCRFNLRVIPLRDLKIAGDAVELELKEHKAELRCALICARQGPMSHVAISVIEDITRQYSTKIERDALELIRGEFEKEGIEP